MQNLTIEQKIRAEISRALRLLGANAYLLATVGSWGDTLSDQAVLELLKDWNDAREGLRN